MIYFDNASSSFPRSPYLKSAFCKYLKQGAGNLNRGHFESAFNLEEKIFDTRQEIKAFFNASDEDEVIFSQGGTSSLNLFIKNILKPGDNCIISPLEHNAVMRPLEYMFKNHNVSYTFIPYRLVCNQNGGFRKVILNVDKIKSLITPSTKAIIVNHASNVTGDVQEINLIGKIARENSLLFCLDTCQSAGSVKIDFIKDNIDFLCFTSHKSLLGLPGSGGAVVSKKCGIEKIEPSIHGGTGSVSYSYSMPQSIPERFEAGTQNIFGIMSIKEGIRYINSIGLNVIRGKKHKLREEFVKNISSLIENKKVNVIGSKPAECDNTGIVSLVFNNNIDIAEVANILDKKYKISTRVGLLCAPLAHKTLETFDEGGVLRFSFSCFNTLKEVKICTRALTKIFS